jgi:hypothetical protein
MPIRFGIASTKGNMSAISQRNIPRRSYKRMKDKLSLLFNGLAISTLVGGGGTQLASLSLVPEAVAQSQPQSEPDRKATPDLAGLLAATRAMTMAKPLPGLSVGEASYPAFGIRILLVDFDQGRFDLRLEEQRAGTGSRSADFLEAKEDVFVVNGGFFEKAINDVLSPSGLLIVDGQVVSREHPRAGSGILTFDGSRVGVAPRKSLTGRSILREALQVGPLLVDPGGVKGIYKDDIERHNRGAFCLRGDQFTAVIVEGGLSLFQFADLLSLPAGEGGFGCAVAINLDGGPSTQALLRAGTDRREVAGGSPVQNAIVISRRN